MSLRDGWKVRLRDMEEAIEKILEYSKTFNSHDEFSADGRTFDAIIRNLQILGEASKKIPISIQTELSEVPWREIRGMRNILVHEYFGANSKIIWRTVRTDLPKLLKDLKGINGKLGSVSHPWRICPPGETYVRRALVHEHLRLGHDVREHLRREHCRESNSSRRDILATQEIRDMTDLFFGELKGLPSANSLEFKNGNTYDIFIRGWAKYWNDIFKPEDPLDPDLVKALIASESSFNPNEGKGKRGKAKGLLQLMPATIHYLKGGRKELKNYIFEFDDTDVFDPNFNIAVGIRWMFRKRETASSRLKRQATWEETVAEYKDYLRRKLKNPNYNDRGMNVFRDAFRKLKDKSGK